MDKVPYDIEQIEVQHKYRCTVVFSIDLIDVEEADNAARAIANSLRENYNKAIPNTIKGKEHMLDFEVEETQRQSLGWKWIE